MKKTLNLLDYFLHKCYHVVMENNSQNRLKRIAAIISLVFIILGFGFMVAALIAQGDIKEILGYISIACYVVGLVPFGMLYVQRKSEERRKKEEANFNRPPEPETEKQAQEAEKESTINATQEFEPQKQTEEEEEKK